MSIILVNVTGIKKCSIICTKKKQKKCSIINCVKKLIQHEFYKKN